MVQIKKAVSPLIATIVLISFTIAIGSLVINWGKQFITAQTQSLQQTGVECQKENAEIVKASLDKTNSNLKFIVRNTGDTNLKFNVLNVYYNDSSVETVKSFIDSNNKKCGADQNTPCSVNKGEVMSYSAKLSNYKNKKIDYIELPSANCPNNLYYYYNVEQ